MTSEIVSSPDLGCVQIYHVKLADITGCTNAGTTTGTIILDAINPGDFIDTSKIRIERITPVAHADATWTVEVGVTGDTDRLIDTIDAKAAGKHCLMQAVTADLLPYVNNSTSDTNLLLTMSCGSSTISATTAGEFAVVVPILRKRDRWVDRNL